MPKGAVSSRRTRIAEDWQPSNDDKAFAEALGVPWDREAPAFVDHHLMHGNLMLSWPAAWRTWCRRTVQYGRATGQRNLPLLAIASAPDPDDAYGAKAWARTLADAVPDKMADGTVALCVGGFDAAATAVDVCRASGQRPEWRGDLSVVGNWLRAGISPDEMTAALWGSTAQGRPLAYYDARIRERAQRRVG